MWFKFKRDSLRCCLDENLLDGPQFLSCLNSLIVICILDHILNESPQQIRIGLFEFILVMGMREVLPLQ
jgi:hypothetical protein